LGIKIAAVKSAFVALIGRPSTGKSTLLNRICAQKVSIISDVPQTTRNKIRGIVNREQGQIVFVDTPGYHDSEKKLNVFLKDLVTSSITEADLVLYLIDSTRPMGGEERSLIQQLIPIRDRLVVAINKADLPSQLRESIQRELEQSFPDCEPVVISARRGDGVDLLVEKLFEKAPEGDRLYPDDIYTDQEPQFRVSEVIREKAIHLTHSEVPHALFVEIADMEMQEDRLWVRAFLYVERDSQKGIVVGKGGSRIRQIRLDAEGELRSLFPYPVQLDLRVKVKPKWRKQELLIKKLIY
jgi:GTP-binding protein Era